jgi:hypothetical protein
MSWNTDPNATSGYTTWSDNNHPIFIFTNTTGGSASPDVELATSINVTDFTIRIPGSQANTDIDFVAADATDRTITFATNATLNVWMGTPSSNPNFTKVAGRGQIGFAGTSGLTFNGLNELGTAASGASYVSVSSVGSLSGVVRINSGRIQVGSSGSLLNVSRFMVMRDSLLDGIANASAGGNFADTATIVLANGRFTMTASAAGTAFNETVGKIVLEGSGRISTVPHSSASVQSTLNLANGFSRGDNGKGVVEFQSSATTGGLGTTPGLEVTGHGFAANQAIIPYAFLSGEYKNVATGTEEGGLGTTRFCATDGSGNLRGANSVAAALDLSTWDTAGYGSTSDLHVNTNTTASTFSNALDGNVAIRSLAIGTTNSSTVNFSLGGNQLKADAIVAASYRGPNMNLGTDDSLRGTITANGASGGDLYLLHGRQNTAEASTFAIRAAVTDNGGAVNLILGGATGQFTIDNQSTNSHTGKTFINANKVTLDDPRVNFLSTSEINISSGAQLVSTAAGNLTLGGGLIAQVLSGGGNPNGAANSAANLIASTRSVIFGANGTFAPGDTGANETFQLTLSTGQLNFQNNSTLAMDLDTVQNSDRIRFLGTAGDWLAGSGNATLALTLGSGFSYANTYTIFENVSTVGYTLKTITGYDTVNYSANFAENGDNYELSFNIIPEPATMGTVGLGALAMLMLRHSRRRKA